MSGIVLDTNVVSETAQPRPAPQVAAWFALQPPGDLFLTATVVGEIAIGAERLPAGRRRTAVEAWLQELLRDQFACRVLSYDADAAMIYGGLVAAARARGRQLNLGDAQIAAVAKLHGMAVATRNVADFKHLGVPVVNPWAAG